MNKLLREDFISDVITELKDSKNIIEFLELYCGFWSAINSSDPYEISYSSGKRDVILTLKTIMRDDLLPETICKMFKEN